MRFLFIMLSIIWLLFAWVSFEALRWRPPLQPPEHAKQALQNFNPKFSDQEKHQMLYLLSADDLPDSVRAKAHFRLAYIYWVETYLKKSHAEQLFFLQTSLDHCLKAASIIPDNVSYIYSIADLYHQMKEFDLAEKYYKKAIGIDPYYEQAVMRYNQLKEEME